MPIVALDVVGATLAQIQVSKPDANLSCLSTSKLPGAFNPPPAEGGRHLKRFCGVVVADISSVD